MLILHIARPWVPAYFLLGFSKTIIVEEEYQTTPDMKTSLRIHRTSSKQLYRRKVLLYEISGIAIFVPIACREQNVVIL
jgi:hypothetical protein